MEAKDTTQSKEPEATVPNISHLLEHREEPPTADGERKGHSIFLSDQTAFSLCRSSGTSRQQANLIPFLRSWIQPTLLIYSCSVHLLLLLRETQRTTYTLTGLGGEKQKQSNKHRSEAWGSTYLIFVTLKLVHPKILHLHGCFLGSRASAGASTWELRLTPDLRARPVDCFQWC